MARSCPMKVLDSVSREKESVRPDLFLSLHRCRQPSRIALLLAMASSRSSASAGGASKFAVSLDLCLARGRVKLAQSSCSAWEHTKGMKERKLFCHMTDLVFVLYRAERASDSSSRRFTSFTTSCPCKRVLLVSLHSASSMPMSEITITTQFNKSSPFLGHGGFVLSNIFISSFSRLSRLSSQTPSITTTRSLQANLHIVSIAPSPRMDKLRTWLQPSSSLLIPSASSDASALAMQAFSLVIAPPKWRRVGSRRLLFPRRMFRMSMQALRARGWLSAYLLLIHP
eukprot:205308-Hanusia_phi.AAC.2